MSSLWNLVNDAAGDAQDLLQHGRYRGAISRAYYAIFTAARALVLEKIGGPPEGLRRHAPVQKLFSEHFVRPGLIDAELGRGLRQLFEKRAEADYSGGAVSEDAAREALEFMERFLDAAAKLREQRQT